MHGKWLVPLCMLLAGAIILGTTAEDQPADCTADAAAGEEVAAAQEEAPPLSVEEQIKKFIADGDEAMRNRQYTTAGKMYSAAVKLDKTQFLPYYKRALSRIQKSSSSAALADLDKVLELQPDYVQAQVQRGNVLMALGLLEDARKQYQEVQRSHPDNTAVVKKLSVAAKAANAYRSMVHAVERKDVKAANIYLTEALSYASESPFLNSLQVLFAAKAHEYDKVAESAMSMAKQNSNDADAIVWRGIAFFKQDRLPVAQQHMKQAIKLDPDHKQAKKWIKIMKKYTSALADSEAARAANKWSEAEAAYRTLIGILEEKHAVVEKIRGRTDISWEVLETLPEQPGYHHPQLHRMYELLCEAQLEQGRNTDAIKSCTAALGIRDDLLDALQFRARARMNLDEFDAAHGDFQKILSFDKNHRGARQGMQDCQRKKKMAERVDHYKILGVERDATPSQIKKAFRKLAVEKHPDKAKDADAKVKAEEEMRKINVAYETLSDPEKRGKYDRGEDVEEHMGGGGNPFHGFNPFGGGFGGFGGGGGGGGGGGHQQFHFRFG